MRIASLAILAAATALPTAGNAASVFFDRDAFDAAVQGVTVVRQDFSDAPDGSLNGPTVFGSGLTVSPVAPTGDNFVRDGVLRLSIDNPNGPADPATLVVDIMLPRASSFFAFDFGEAILGADNSQTTGRGPGNNSGTTLTAGTFSFDFADPDPAYPGTFPNGYTGFFGVMGDMGETFQTLSFASNGMGTKTDDDFTVTSVSFEGEPAPIPLPAGLPLLVAGLGALGLMRRRGR